jgi:hypothetical protein
MQEILFTDRQLITNAPNIWARLPMIGSILCLLAQAGMAFHRYRFNNGLIFGTTMAAVACYADTVQRKGINPSQLQLTLIATGTAALITIAQQELRALVHL